MSEYFFELVAEEIPAWMLESKSAEIAEKLTKIAGDFAGRVSPGQIEVGATSRRIWFVVRDLPTRQADRTEEVKGPPAKSAYDGSGNPAPALAGFLRKHGAAPESATVRGDYVFITRTVSGLDAASLLSREIPPLIEGLRWPKMMRWGRGEFAYIRPVHSVISLLDGRILPIKIFGTAAGDATVGHRVLSRDTITVQSFDDYGKKLAAAKVIIRPQERVEMMRQRARALAEEVGGHPAMDESIWDQWKYLTEYPGLIRAEFEERFLALPEEVLITVMRVHQKQLPIVSKGHISSSFLAVVDHDSDGKGNARIGNSFVSNARFADAKFFHDTDRRRTLESRLPELEHLQFQEKLGDYRRKVERVVALAEIARKDAGGDAPASEVRRAAELCKTDLVTEMVKEFTELQGQIGGIYAREENEPETVWQAIYDHYLPLAIDGKLPRNEVGALVSLADKADTLAGFFSIGLKPTGSRDPFALRRAAQGLVQLLLNRAGWSIELSLDRLVRSALEGYSVPAERLDTVQAELIEFISDRVRTLLESEPFNFAYDEIAAAMAAGWTASLHDLHDRVVALRAIREDAQFLSLLDSVKRIANITADAPSTGALDAGLLQHPTEKRLAELISLTGEQVDEMIGHRDYLSALESFAGMAPELEKFFTDVMVMVDDEKLRQNRITLLRRCGNVVGRIADLSRVVVDRSEYRQGQ